MLKRFWHPCVKPSRKIDPIASAAGSNPDPNVAHFQADENDAV